MALVLIAAALFGLWQVHVEVAQLRGQFAEAVQRTFDQRFDGVTKDVDAIAVKVDEQTAIINRGLGVIIPYKLPDDVITRLSSVQAQISSAVQTPVDLPSIDTIRAELASIVDALPPWAQEEILPKLVPMRWELESLWVLTSTSDGNSASLSGREATLDTLLANRPVGTSQSLADKLETARQETAKQIVTSERATAIAMGKSAASGPKNFTEVSTAIRLLSVYEDEEATALTAQLNRVLLAGSLRASLTRIRDDRQKYEAIDNPVLKEFALARTAEETMDLRLRVLAGGFAGQPLAREADALGKNVSDRVDAAVKERRTRQAEQLRGYQQWALKEIQAVPTYKSLLATQLDAIPSKLDRVNPTSAVREAAVASAQMELREAIVLHLAPIDQGLLDVPVGEWYRKVYQERFGHLDDEKEQIAVIKAFVDTPKKTLEYTP